MWEVLKSAGFRWLAVAVVEEEEEEVAPPASPPFPPPFRWALGEVAGLGGSQWNSDSLRRVWGLSLSVAKP